MSARAGIVRDELMMREGMLTCETMDTPRRLSYSVIVARNRDPKETVDDYGRRLRLTIEGLARCIFRAAPGRGLSLITRLACFRSGCGAALLQDSARNV